MIGVAICAIGPKIHLTIADYPLPGYRPLPANDAGQLLHRRTIQFLMHTLNI
jgi:hypothetical protein